MRLLYCILSFFMFFIKKYYLSTYTFLEEGNFSTKSSPHHSLCAVPPTNKKKLNRCQAEPNGMRLLYCILLFYMFFIKKKEGNYHLQNHHHTPKNFESKERKKERKKKGWRVFESQSVDRFVSLMFAPLLCFYFVFFFCEKVYIRVPLINKK